MNGNATCLAVVNSDTGDLMLSSSGGAFSLLARKTLGCGGVVYGHAFDEDMHVGCVRADNIGGLVRMRGSKYVQSDMGDAMRGVRADLEAGREVLFSGTPCQVDGLLAYLGGPRGGLLAVDIVCHGVPSQKFFLDCMGFEFKGAHLDEVRFRDTREGWGCGGGTTTTTTPVFHRYITRDRPFSPLNSYYYKSFLAGSVYRESCYRCPYAGGERPGDLTIGDFWGIDVEASGLDSKRGISVVIANSPKGESLLSYIKCKSSWAERPLEEAVKGNRQLMHPTPRSDVRDTVLDRWLQEGIDVLEVEYRRTTALPRAWWLFKQWVKKVLRKMHLRP